MINYIPRRFTVVRDKSLCVNCGLCVNQCANDCHYYSSDDKKTLLDLKNALTNYKALHNLIRLFGYDDLYIHFDVDKAIQMLNEVNNRISIINLKEKD